MNTLAPIVLFTYKRLDTLIKTVEALQKNKLAADSDLFVFSDAAKTDNEKQAITEVRDFLKSITGFKSVTINEASHNKGLANSIIEGVSQVLMKFDKVIVLEDDLLTSNNFLSFMNQGLDYYKDKEKIISICGYNMKVKNRKDCDYPFDVFFAMRSASWGWATWKEKWLEIDWAVIDFNEFSTSKKQKKLFNKMGSDMSGMLKSQQLGLNNSWAIRFCYHQFKNQMYSVYPFLSKVRNIGFSQDATHTRLKYNRFDVDLDKECNIDFDFKEDIEMEKDIITDFIKINSYRSRFVSKIKNFFHK